MWIVGLAAVAAARYASTIRPARTARHVGSLATLPAGPEPVVRTVEAAVPQPPAGQTAQPRPVLTAGKIPSIPGSKTAAGLWAALREYRRDRVLWALLIVVPVFFVALAAAQTPTKPMPVALLDGARHFTTMISLRHIHAGEMASIASALLAGITGLFVVTGSAPGDRRLVLAGFRPRQILAGHLGVIAGATVVISAVSLAVSAAFFAPRFWVEFAGADLLIALTYAMIGVLLGPLVGRLGGLYLLLLLSIVDVGYGQTVMFHPNPPGWGAFLPARGAGRLMLDGAFTTSFERYGYLLLALGWLAGLTLAAVAVFKHRIGAVPPAFVPARPVGEPVKEVANRLSASGRGGGVDEHRASPKPQNCLIGASHLPPNLKPEEES
jgi:hypothetical protein